VDLQREALGQRLRPFMGEIGKTASGQGIVLTDVQDFDFFIRDQNRQTVVLAAYFNHCDRLRSSRSAPQASLAIH
jgi:hypothetical protein